jgi:hypothetical protein
MEVKPGLPERKVPILLMKPGEKRMQRWIMKIWYDMNTESNITVVHYG